MPVLPVDPDRSVLIVGNGPSSTIVSWRKVHQALRPRSRRVDLALINRRAASGGTVPQWAVSVDRTILAEYARKLPPRVTAITNRLDRVARGHEDDLSDALGERLLCGRRDWPAHASGPLAVWTAVSMGYSRIYLYGLDGTAAAPGGTSSGAFGPGVRPGVWETWIRRAERARSGQPGCGEIWRIWPDRRWAKVRDPLAPVLAGTLYGVDLLAPRIVAAPGPPA